MTGIPKSKSYTFGSFVPSSQRNLAEQRDGSCSISGGVDWRDGSLATPLIAPVEMFNLALLNMGGIRKHNRTQIDGRRRCKDWSAVAHARELRQQAGMIDMRMGQNDGINISGLEWEPPIVQFLFCLRTLKQAAVDQYSCIRRLDELARSSHRAGGAVKVNGGVHRHLICLLRIDCGSAEQDRRSLPRDVPGPVSAPTSLQGLPSWREYGFQPGREQWKPLIPEHSGMRPASRFLRLPTCAHDDR